MKQMHIAESVLNRMLNFMDQLDGKPIAAQGAAIDAALAMPTPAMPAAQGMDEELVRKGLKLAPPR